jgi:hypothetical protein
VRGGGIGHDHRVTVIERYGIERGPLGRPGLIPAAAAATLAAFALAYATAPEDVDKVLTPVLGGVALLIGLWQWRAARQEASLERYFDRLEVPNQRWCEYYQHVIELLAEAPRETPGWQEQVDDALEQLYRFYCFAELDNFEYAIRKYRIGYMSDDLAQRAAETFHSRCAGSVEFWHAADASLEGCGYSADFVAIVRRILDDTRPPADGSGRVLLQSWAARLVPPPAG